MKKKILISGTSSGLGKYLAKKFRSVEFLGIDKQEENNL